MSGVAIARALLLAHAPTVALVPASCILSGVIPQNTPAPAIGITEISSVDHKTVNRPTLRKVRERVQVTALAGTYPALKAILAQVRQACGDKAGTVGNFTGITCHLDGRGPDFNDESGLVMQSQDLLITFDEAVV